MNPAACTRPDPVTSGRSWAVAAVSGAAAPPEIPVTLTGKKMEVPVRKILRGVPADEAVNRNAMANPDSLDFFIGYAAAHQDYSNA